MPVRRSADPLSVQYVWDAIKYSNQQKQVADLGRIVKFIQKVANCSQTQAELYIKQTIDDDMIVEVKKLVHKGNNIGSEVESYKINRPEELETPTNDGYDWYCIECHLGGDVNTCSKCYRVFHLECSTNARHKHTFFPKAKYLNTVDNPTTVATESIEPAPDADKKEETESSVVEETKENDEENSGNKVNSHSSADYIYDETLCSHCNLEASDPGSGLDKEEFNYLLNFIHLRIKSWVPEQLTSTLTLEQKYEWYTPSELKWRSTQLFYRHIDMSIVESKIQSNDYEKFSEFQADVVTMLHNVAIFHGVESQEFGAAELMLRDMKYDISELQNCVDCYKHSNEKINDKWFCLPCRVPHQLVWAKQKGYPYWPAKVLRETDTTYDVRFFSGKYERSILPKNCIKPISTSLSQLNVKKSFAFNKAVVELNLHQKLLDNPTEVAKILSVKKPKKASKPKKSLSPIVQKSNAAKPVKTSSTDDIYEFHDSPSDFGEKSNDGLGTKRKQSYNSESPLSKPKKKLLTTPLKTNNQKTPNKDPPQDVPNISDVDVDEEKNESFQFPQENCDFSDGGQEQVTSSTELVREDTYNSREGTDTGMQKLDQPYSDAVERMRRKLEQCKDKKQLILQAMDCMQIETDRITNEHNDTLKKLFEAHNTQISETKKKQWCFNCEQDAIYHCCWNTAYCSPSCQQQHWQAEHKKVCRRKR
ncbi:PREDICTED: zinc finger MYND domain-containing protein 11 [Nicrophorus vespilloides]|uniref:Zinc finger MYND domain-containing protein 11 n=1 Tax=Nicrophorus vespilloides TaxID=110193 RepID=A0ABM1M931_NICVS|nr:PREDICTED: zinc finger MYND domain-containing protein 11 [Nicrophorus vespilloides]